MATYTPMYNARTLADKRIVGGEAHVVGEKEANRVWLYEVPVPDGTLTVEIGGVPLTEVETPTPAAGEFYVHYDDELAGAVDFNVSQAGASVLVDYSGIGSPLPAHILTALQVEKIDRDGTVKWIGAPLPAVTLTHALGSATFRWNNVYSGGGDFTGNVTVVGTITEAGTSLAAKYAPISHVHSAADITTGTLLSARLAGAYAGITTVGTLTSLTVTGTIDALNGLNLGAGGAQGIISWGTAPYLRGAVGKGAGLYGGGGANGITVSATGAVDLSSTLAVAGDVTATSQVRTPVIGPITAGAAFIIGNSPIVLVGHTTTAGAIAGDTVAKQGAGFRAEYMGGTYSLVRLNATTVCTEVGTSDTSLWLARASVSGIGAVIGEVIVANAKAYCAVNAAGTSLARLIQLTNANALVVGDASYPLYFASTDIPSSRVTLGAADSGGAGYRILRIPN